MYISYKDAAESDGELTPDMLVADLDGTLTRISAVTARLASVSDKVDLSLSRAFVWGYRKTLSACDSLGINRERIDRLKSTLTPVLACEQEDSFIVLCAATDNNIPCVLVSNGPEQWGNYMLKSMKLQYFFDKAIFRESMPGLKPDPRSLVPAMECAPKTSGRLPVVWIYGDRPSDMILAANANKALPYTFVPVAIQGTKAAEAIENHPVVKSCSLSIVFESQFALACTLRPEIYRDIKKLADQKTNPPATIDFRVPS